ncbi:MAG: cell wall-binding repeat-containing protein [Clostridioides sp.]|jgi:cell wall-associated protease|nr:cell wall-binding repeat-containing protein [Clostridioides sp.]
MKVNKFLKGVAFVSIILSMSTNVVLAGGSQTGAGITFEEGEPEDPGGGGGGSVDKKYVILASGQKYTDVLTSTVLANEKKCPILLTAKDSVDDQTLAEIKRLKTDEVIISGGTDSVSENVVSQLSNAYTVRRIAGKNRYETAIQVGNEVRDLTGNKSGAMLVDGTNFPDVITISGLATQRRIPILLTTPASLSKSTEDTIANWSIRDITIGGGTNSVSKKIENNLSVDSVARFGGTDRYETAVIVGQEVRNKTGNLKDMVLVDGTDFPDGLTVSTLAANFKAPILLTKPSELHYLTKSKMKNWAIENVLIGGGPSSVSEKIETTLDAKKVERVSGANRYETAVKISQRLTRVSVPIGRMGPQQEEKKSGIFRSIYIKLFGRG